MSLTLIGDDDRAIAAELRRIATGGAACALATVVRVVGSAYRGVGARLLVRRDGTAVGMVSGGCLEGDLAARAAAVISSGNAELVTYDTSSGDDLVWGLGLGCEGTVELLLEPLAPTEGLAVASLLDRALTAETPRVIATLFQVVQTGARPLGRLLLDPRGEVEAWHGSVPEAIEATVREDVIALLEEGPPRARGIARVYRVGAETLQLSLEPIFPPLRLLVCGAGPDAAPVARLAREQGWQVTVVDHRPISALHGERFAGVRVAHCADSRTLADCVQIDARTHVAIMSHHFERDLGYLAALLASSAPYVGLLGPRSRAERLFAEHRARIGPIDESAMARVHAPIGLDLGGDDAGSVALAIVAELMAVSNGRSGAPLRAREAPIHASGDGRGQSGVRVGSEWKIVSRDPPTRDRDRDRPGSEWGQSGLGT